MIYLKEGKTPLNFAYNDEIIQEGNSKYQLSFKFPTNNPLWEELVEETLLLADDLHGEQEFIIFEVEKHHAYITIYANQVATLLNNYSITELSVNNASGDRVMRSLVSSIIREHQFTFSSDIANTHSLNLKNVTVANALFKDKHSIIGQWGGDLIRDKYDIRLLSNGGSNKEALFMYKKNLKSYQQKKSIKDLRTRIHFTKTINSQKEGEKDKVIAVTVDSPLIGKYKNIYEGNLDVSDQDVTDEATLRKYGENYFKTTLCDVIEENIEIDVVGTPDEPVGIFDTVTIFHEKFNLDVKKKITKYTYSPMGRKLKTIGFGKIQSNLGTTLASMVDNAVSEQIESRVDAFKIQKNLAQLLKSDRKGIEDKLVELEEKSKGALEVKKALFEADGTIPDVVKTKILDAVEGDIGRLKTIITEAELIKAIQAKLNFAEIKNALIDKAFINQIVSDESFTQQFQDGEVNTQNIFTKLKDSIKSNISKEFMTKDGVRKLVNDLTIDADGIRQITQQESEKVFEKKKAELKGIDSYIHRKYSDFADGRNMSDNSTLKYIGIYTGEKEQAPTNASKYSWTKIRGEDGAQGRNGDSYTRNYLTGTADEKILTAVNDNFTTQEAFKLVDGKNFRDLGFNVGDKVTFIADYEVLPNETNKKISGLNFEWYDDNRYRFWMNQDLNPTKATFTRTVVANNDLLDCKRVFLRTDNVNAKIKITNARVIKGDTVQPWSIAQEDLQGHTLTANVRFEGTYINNVTNNLRVFLDVYYDRRKIALGFNAQVKYKGGNRSDWSGFWNANVDSTGRITNIDWGNREQNGEPLDVIVLVTYKDKDAIASARTDNTPNIGELKETIQRYKRFESTLSEFRSEIGYVKETTQILGDTVPDILRDNRTQTGNDVYFNSSTTLESNTWYTIVADISGLKGKQETGIYNASGTFKKYILNGRNFWVVKFPIRQNRVNFYPLGNNTTIKNVRVYEGDFTETLQGNLYVTHTIAPSSNRVLVISLNKKVEGKDLVLYFDVDGDVTNKTFQYSNAINNFSDAIDIEFPLKNRDNVISVGDFRNSSIALIFNYANPTIKNVRVYEVDYAFRKLTKTQTQNIGTVFKQSAEDIIIAWNNYNKYFSFNNETLDILEKDNYQNKYKKISLTSEGLKIYNNNTLIGTIGTFTHLGQSFRQNTLDIVLTNDTKAFGVYTWQDFNAFGSRVTGYAPLFEIKQDDSGTYMSYFHQPVQTREAYIDSLNIAETGASYVKGINKTINVGGRNLRFVQGILVSG